MAAEIIILPVIRGEAVLRAKAEPTIEEQIRAVRGAIETFDWIAPKLHLSEADTAAHRRRLEAAIASLQAHQPGGVA